MKKRAVELVEGDRLTGAGESPPRLYSGVVRSAIVVGNGIQINLADGGIFTRPEDHEVEVEEVAS